MKKIVWLLIVAALAVASVKIFSLNRVVEDPVPNDYAKKAKRAQSPGTITKGIVDEAIGDAAADLVGGPATDGNGAAAPTD